MSRSGRSSTEGETIRLNDSAALNSARVVRGPALVGARRLGPVLPVSVVPSAETNYLSLENQLAELIRVNERKQGTFVHEAMGGLLHDSLLYLPRQLKQDGIGPRPLYSLI